MDDLSPLLNGVHVLPFHPSSGDGGFSVIDHAAVDPSLGTWDDVRDLADRHRLMADLVINHVSARGRWFEQWLKGDPARDDWFRVIEPGTDLGAVVRPRPGPPRATVRRKGAPVDVWATFSPDQIDLDFRTPAVLRAIVDEVLRHVEHGATVVRLDAVAFVWKDPSRRSIHEPEAHAIVAVLRSVLDEIDPSIVLVTETNVPHDDNVAYFGTATRPEAHAVYQFTLAPLVLHAVHTGDAGPLRRWASRLEHPRGATFLNFLASHDGVGVRPAAGWLGADAIAALADRCRSVGGVVNEAATATGSEPYELAATWRSLCGAGVGDDEARRRHVATHAVMLALAGVPLLYVHSLTGSANDRARFAVSGLGRDLNRGRFADPAGYARALAAGAVWAPLRRMLEWRRSSAAFHPDAAQRVHDAPAGAFVVERGAAGERALVATNLAAAPVRVPVGSGWSTLDGEPVPASVRLTGYESCWLVSRS